MKNKAELKKYRKGARKEREIMKLLEESGAVHTIRSAGSKGIIDIVAVFREWIALIQVKPKGGLSVLEFQKLQKLAKQVPRNVVVLLVEYEPRKTPTLKIISKEG